MAIERTIRHAVKGTNPESLFYALSYKQHEYERDRGLFLTLLKYYAK